METNKFERVDEGRAIETGTVEADNIYDEKDVEFLLAARYPDDDCGC